MGTLLARYIPDYKVVKVQVGKIPKWQLEQIKDITCFQAAVFTAAEELDLSSLRCSHFDQDITTGYNEKGNPIISVSVKAYLPDGHDFVGPQNHKSNNLTNERNESTIAIINYEYLGEVDEPSEGSSYIHYESIRRDLAPPKKKLKILTSSRSGVKGLVRYAENFDNGESLVGFSTFIVSNENKVGSDYWVCSIHTLNQFTLGYASDAKVFVTLTHGGLDHKAEKLN